MRGEDSRGVIIQLAIETHTWKYPAGNCSVASGLHAVARSAKAGDATLHLPPAANTLFV